MYKVHGLFWRNFRTQLFVVWNFLKHKKKKTKPIKVTSNQIECFTLVMVGLV